MKSKIWKLILGLVVAVTAISLIGCAGSTAAPSASSQTGTVRRGDLSVTITASGNLALAHTEDLSFQIGGYVSDVLVEAGDAVKKGQVLAKVDTTDWDKKIRGLETALVTAQRRLSALEITLDKNIRTVDDKELAVRQAENALATAQYNLTQMADVKIAQDAIDKAEDDLKLAKSMTTGAMGSTVQAYDTAYWGRRVIDAQAALDKAKNDIADILKGTSIKVTNDVALQVKSSQLLGEKAQRDLDQAKLNWEYANVDVANAKLDVEKGKQDVADAQSDLDEAKATPTSVAATFDGFVTKVGVSGGDEIFKGKVAATIADPNKFEADILVSEKDIPSVKVDGKATISVDSMPGVVLPATVTYIAPTATIQSGVVNYQVKVELDSSTPIMRLPAATTSTSPATGSAQVTPTPSASGRPSTGGGQTSRSAQASRGGQAALSGITPQTVQLRQGLAITVDIILEQKTNVLLVPNRAIVRQGRDVTVQVTKDGAVSPRVIKIGINDVLSTEVTDGLGEGEQVVLQQTTSSTSSTSQSFGAPGGGGAIRIPGGIGR